MTRHPDPGVLAECREGLLGRRRAARVRAHLASCPHCTSLDAGLAEVSELLAGSPAPSMPDHLIARLDRALAAEAARRPAAGQATPAADDAAGPVPGGTAAEPDGPAGSAPRAGRGRRSARRPASARPASARRPARLRPAVLGGAAAVIVIAAAAFGLAGLTQRHGGTAAGSAGGGSGPVQHSSSFNSPGAGTSGQPGAVPNHPSGPQDITPGSALHVISSGTDYQHRTLASQAAAVLASHPPTYSGQAQKTAIPAMRACVARVTHGRTLLVDVARYQGRPATIIVAESPTGQQADVWVTGAACSAGRSDILDKATLPSPG